MPKHKISGVVHNTENKYLLKFCALGTLFSSPSPSPTTQ